MVDLLVTYMEMISPLFALPVTAPGAGVSVASERLSREAYLDIYRAVGQAVQWDQRLHMDAATLDELLAEPSNPVYVLRAEGSPAGLCEFAGFGGPDVELVHFGLVPEAQGRGLGRYLLDGALRACWALSPKRVWLHTDTNDHPRAVATYERAGFRPYLRRWESFPD